VIKIYPTTKVKEPKYAMKIYFRLYSETLLIGPPSGPTMSDNINEVALLMKLSLMFP